MKAWAALGVSLMVGVEVLALLTHQRQIIPAASGAAVAALLFGVRRVMAGAASAGDDAGPEHRTDLLRRWLSSTETLVYWSERTRADWDRHWRPILGRKFEVTTGQRRTKDRAAFDATGRMLFGPELWAWVDPENVTRTEGGDPGPGRDTLAEILQRLEQP